jgi:hypothetical protein
VVDPARGDGFYGEVRKYWPALPDGATDPWLRRHATQDLGPGRGSGRLHESMALHRTALQGLVNLFGIESPGLTSSLAIGAPRRAACWPSA